MKTPTTIIWREFLLTFFFVVASSMKQCEAAGPFLRTDGTSKTISIADYGARSGDTGHALTNLLAFKSAIRRLETGDTLLVPQGKWYSFGGISFENAPSNITFFLNGTVSFVFDLESWPFNWRAGRYHDCISFHHVSHFTITSDGNGFLEGNGKAWWDGVILGSIDSKARPLLLYSTDASDLLIKYVTISNPPRWAIRVNGVRMEIHHINVTVDRGYQRHIASTMKNAKQDKDGKLSLFQLQPEDLNTDGIDPSGQDIHVHDCTILNDDDSVAVKPTRGPQVAVDGTAYSCTENVLIENMILVGFGASLGSVGPSSPASCVNNVTFKNISMPDTGKGIYIKSDKSDCVNVSSQITNILYENIKIIRPRWWAIWIGPQQQHEPWTDLEGDCALAYPVRPECPTQGCTKFENLTLKDIQIIDPWLSPGVILGNSTNPMKNIVFNNVSAFMSDGGSLPEWPFNGYKWEFAYGQCIGRCDPMPDFSPPST